jgi:hypothetical protein
MGFAFTTGSATIGTTEFSIISGSTTLPTETTDLIQQATVWFGALASGDVYRVRVYESADDATKRVAHEAYVAHAQAEPGYVLPPILLGVGYDITVTRIAGTDRTIRWTYARVT